MWRSNSSVSSRSSFPPDIANSEHVPFENDNAFNFNKWNIPKLSPKNIYTDSSWLKSSFRSEYAVKTVEQTFVISSNNATFQLFNKRFVENSKFKGYKFLHIGSIQVAIKPLTRFDINALVLLCLRDARFLNFRTSILGMIQSSLFASPIHFDVFPNLTLSLDDVNMLKALTLNVLTSSYDMKEGSRPLAIIYHIYYQLMKTNLNPQAIVKDLAGSTMLIQSSTQDAIVRTPKMIRWDEVTLPNEWLLENVSKPINVVTGSSDVDLIQQYLDGTVKINFADLNVSSSRIQRPLVIEAKRNSFAGSATTEGFQKRDKEIDELLSASDLKLKGVTTNSQISSAFYSTKTHSPTHKDDNSSSVSPSASNMNGPLPPPQQIPHQLKVIHASSKEFFSHIDWPTLQKDFSSKKNKDLRYAYRSRFSEREKDLIKAQ